MSGRVRHPDSRTPQVLLRDRGRSPGVPKTKISTASSGALHRGVMEDTTWPHAPFVSLFAESTFSDDAIRVATAGRRARIQQSSPRAPRCMLGVRGRCESKSRRARGKSSSSYNAQAGQHAGRQTVAEAHMPAIKRPKHQAGTTATADLAVSACREVSARRISEGGLGPYFLTEVFRRAFLRKSFKDAGQHVPVSSHVIASLSVGTCDDPSTCCSICFKQFSNEGVTLPCAHLFHKKCIMPWLHHHNSCPCCRAPVESSPPPHPAWISPSQGACSRAERRKFSVEELALRLSQWDGMTHEAIARFASAAEALAPISCERKRKTQLHK